jgi:probable phosphoglycerate mutase
MKQKERRSRPAGPALSNWCRACKVERDNLLPSEAFVLGLVVADLDRIGRLRKHATLCDRHGQFPHRPGVDARTMKQVFLIRHGESESNAGGRTHAPHATGITTRGQAQAGRLATLWNFGEPQLIVTSPFVRTQHTAEPFIERFSAARREEWPVEEFTQLCPREWLGTTHVERAPKVAEYWDRADPHYCDGPGAESFTTLFKRVRGLLSRASETKEDHIVIFTHGTFMQAVMWACIRNAVTDTSGAMKEFFQFSQVVPIDNTAILPLVKQGSHWFVGPIRHPTV